MRWSSSFEQTPESAFLRVTAGLSPHAHGFHVSEIFLREQGLTARLCGMQR